MCIYRILVLINNTDRVWELVVGMGVSLLYKGYRRLWGCILLISVSLCISGCWDRKELEERHFVLAVGIDRADEGGGPGQGVDSGGVEGFVQPHSSKRYRLSLQIMDLTPPQSSMGGLQTTKGGTLTYVISNTGDSLLQMIRDMLGQVSRGLWFEHVQAIVISEEAVRQGGLQPIMDLFRRNAEIRWLTKILLTSGQARSILEYHPPNGEASGVFMSKSLQLYRKNPHVAGWHTDVGDFSKSMDSKRRVLVSRVELLDGVIKLGGMALFTGGKFIGYVDEYATKGGKFLSGIEKSAVITAQCGEHPGKIIVFQNYRHDTKLTPYVDQGKIYYTLEIAMTGNLAEIQCGKLHDTMDAEEIHKIEKMVAEEVKRNALYAFYTYQRLRVDADDFSGRLKAYEPLVWEKVKDNWDEEVFPTISLVVSVAVTIQSIGGHK